MTEEQAKQLGIDPQLLRFFPKRSGSWAVIPEVWRKGRA